MLNERRTHISKHKENNQIENKQTQYNIHFLLLITRKNHMHKKSKEFTLNTDITTQPQYVLGTIKKWITVLYTVIFQKMGKQWGPDG